MSQVTWVLFLKGAETLFYHSDILFGTEPVTGSVETHALLLRSLFFFLLELRQWQVIKPEVSLE